MGRGVQVGVKVGRGVGIGIGVEVGSGSTGAVGIGVGEGAIVKVGVGEGVAGSGVASTGAVVGADVGVVMLAHNSRAARTVPRAFKERLFFTSPFRFAFVDAPEKRS